MCAQCIFNLTEITVIFNHLHTYFLLLIGIFQAHTNRIETKFLDEGFFGAKSSENLQKVSLVPNDFLYLIQKANQIFLMSNSI